jgi:diphthamide synthase subunit DPH2
MAKKTIVICTSAAFYKRANEIAEEIEKLGFNAVIPSTATRMKRDNNYDVSRVKPWYKNPRYYTRKQSLAGEHFEKVAKGDAVLIINDDKPGKPTYIGPNTLMEWGLAYYLNKPIFVLNGVAKDHNAHEEVYGMSTTVLDGDLAKIKL